MTSYKSGADKAWDIHKKGKKWANTPMEKFHREGFYSGYAAQYGTSHGKVCGYSEDDMALARLEEKHRLLRSYSWDINALLSSLPDKDITVEGLLEGVQKLRSQLQYLKKDTTRKKDGVKEGIERLQSQKAFKRPTTPNWVSTVGSTLPTVAGPSGPSVTLTVRGTASAPGGAIPRVSGGGFVSIPPGMIVGSTSVASGKSIW